MKFCSSNPCAGVALTTNEHSVAVVQVTCTVVVAAAAAASATAVAAVNEAGTFPPPRHLITTTGNELSRPATLPN